MTFKEELEEILKSELKVLKKLTKLAYRKTNFIMEDDLENLKSVVLEEEKLVNKIGKLEESRVEHLNSWGVSTSTPLFDVINKLPEGKKELIKLRKDLEMTIIKLEEQNKRNEELVKQNLEWLEFNLNLITTSSQPASYGQNKDENQGDSGLFDRKV